MNRLLLLSALLLSACAGPDLPTGIDEGEITADGNHFSQGRVYYSPGPDGCSEPEYSCATEVKLCPDGSADYFGGGDILYRYEYNIDGDDLVMIDDFDQQLLWTIEGNDALGFEGGGLLPRVSDRDPGCSPQ